MISQATSPGQFGFVALRRYAPDVVRALAFIVELHIVMPATVLAVLEPSRPDELWRGAWRLERLHGGRRLPLADAVRDHRTEEQGGDETYGGDPGDDDGVLADRLSGFRHVPPPSHSSRVCPQADGRQTAPANRPASLHHTVSFAGVLLKQCSAKLSETVRRVIEHSEDRDPIGMRQRDLGLHGHQRVHDPVSLVVQIGTAQSNDEREQGLVGELDSGKAHHRSASSIGIGSSGFRTPRPRSRVLAPHVQSPSVFPAEQDAVETRNCLA